MSSSTYKELVIPPIGADVRAYMESTEAAADEFGGRVFNNRSRSVLSFSRPNNAQSLR